ncbi:hypothetical protein GXW82_22155 [Streptacidiphilus sp. 4-A2]|nr:hypothetical protein [Streptacidiphilus sp. 4-A2]
MSSAPPDIAVPVRRRRLLPPRPPRAGDVGFALSLLFVEVAVWMLRGILAGFTLVPVTTAEFDHSQLVFAGWEIGIAIAALAIALPAALLRAPWTACIQLLVAVVVGVMGLSAQHHYGDTTPQPAPTDTYYAPCYSGTDCERN